MSGDPAGTGGDDGASEHAGGTADLMAGFRSAGDGATARFAAGQAGIIRNLVSQVADLIGGGTPDSAPGESLTGGSLTGGSLTAEAAAGTGPDSPDAALLAGSAAALAAELQLTDAATPPSDPALARLLPDAYRDDPQAAAEFRRYTEHGLRSAKIAAARTVLATLPARGGRIRLTAADSQAWLRALNDVRLALSVRLDVTEDFDSDVAQMDRGDPRFAYVWVYQWLAYLQETLVEALS